MANTAAAKKTATKTSKSATTSAPKNAMYYPEHEKTYDIFLFMFKWGTIFCVGLLVLMAIFLL
jgi:hypothetical protein